MWYHVQISKLAFLLTFVVFIVLTLYIHHLGVLLAAEATISVATSAGCHLLENIG